MPYCHSQISQILLEPRAKGAYQADWRMGLGNSWRLKKQKIDLLNSHTSVSWLLLLVVGFEPTPPNLHSLLVAHQIVLHELNKWHTRDSVARKNFTCKYE